MAKDGKTVDAVAVVAPTAPVAPGTGGESVLAFLASDTSTKPGKAGSSKTALALGLEAATRQLGFGATHRWEATDGECLISIPAKMACAIFILAQDGVNPTLVLLEAVRKLPADRAQLHAAKLQGLKGRKG